MQIETSITLRLSCEELQALQILARSHADHLSITSPGGNNTVQIEHCDLEPINYECSMDQLSKIRDAIMQIK